MVDTSQADIGLVDAALEAEAGKLGPARAGTRDPRGAAVDGYQIVDSRTQKVFDWGPWLPIVLPQNVQLPSPGPRPYIDQGDLYVVQTDTNGRLIATSLVFVGSVLWVAVGGAATFVIGTGIAWVVSRRFLRGYFALRTVRIVTLEEALRIGEGQTVEFNRRLSDDPSRTRTAEGELLKSIAAFANTNDGVIFIGVDDSGRVVGLQFDFKQRDRFEQKIRQLTRSHIRPIPSGSGRLRERPRS